MRHLTETQAMNLMGTLVTMTTGWNDDAVDVMVEQIKRKWSDEAAAVEAVDSVVASWEQSSRPPWGVLMTAYRAAVRRRALDAPALSTSSWASISAAEGRKVAAKAYAQACRLRDPETDQHILSGFRSTEPNPLVFDRLLGFKHDADG
jgi:hypothetical protein